MSDQSLHVRIHRDVSGYWAEVKEWPGRFATGGSWDELTECLERAIGLYMTPEDREAPMEVALRIREIEVEVDADMPLIRGRAEDSATPLPPLPRTRDPHPDWPPRDFRYRDEP